MKRRHPELWLLAVLLGVGLPGAVLFHLYGPRSAAPLSPATATTPSPETVALEVGDEPAVPAIWLDVHRPAALRQAATRNAWLQQALKAPIGEGFLGTWGGFLGTRGEDVALGFKGTVLDVLMDQVLDSPFRVTWFAGASGTSTPTLMIPTLSGAAKTAISVLDGSAKGAFSAADCPGDAALPTGPIEIKRWLLADHAVYAYSDAQRLFLARHPLAVLHAVCEPGSELASRKEVDVEVHFSAPQLGREAQTLASALGLGKEVSLALGLEGDRLVPRGLMAELLVQGRLGKAALPPDALKLVPSDTSVVLSLQVPLPVPLSAESLQTYWKEGAAAKREVRHVLLAWQPRGDPNLPDEWALIWGRAGDLPALQALFSESSFPSGTVCDQAVLASNTRTFNRFQDACGGRQPNLLNSAKPVVEGLRAPSSIGLGVNLGSLLSHLVADGFHSEHGTRLKGSAPPEIEEARRQLEALPFLGFHGIAEGGALVPGGFGS